MIEAIISVLNTKISALNIFQNIFGVCEIVREGEKSYPAFYNNKDNLKYIDEGVDYKQGVIFHLKDGNQTREELERIRARSKNIQITTPMTAVAIVRKSIYNTDDAYMEYQLTRNISKLLDEDNNTELKEALKMNRVYTGINEVNHDKQAILDQYFAGVDMNMRHDIAVVSVSYDIVIEGDEECIEMLECDGKESLDILAAVCDKQIENMTCEEINNGLTQDQREKVILIHPLRTGQTTSYAVGDDGNIQVGRGADWFTLNCENEFGNLIRFTDENGAYQDQNGDYFDKDGNSIDASEAFQNEVFIDHETNLMWTLDTKAFASWATSVADALASNTGGFDNWLLPNRNEMLTLSNMELTSVFNWFPLSVNTNLASSSTVKSSPDSYWRMISSGVVGTRLKTLTDTKLYVRKYISS